MLVWSSRPFPILGCLITSIVMENPIKEYSDKSEKQKIIMIQSTREIWKISLVWSPNKC